MALNRLRRYMQCAVVIQELADGRQTEIECRATLDLRLGPDGTAQPGDYPVSVGQAYPRAFELAGPMQALKRAKQLVRALHVKTDAVISHKNHHFVLAALTGTDFDHCRIAATGVFDGVAQQIDQHLP